MAKSFKLRLSKVINMTLQSCRSTDPSDLPEEPVPPLFRLSPNSKLITVDFPVNQLPSRMKSAAGNHQVRRMSSSSDPTIASAFIRSYSSSREFKWEKEEKWHVIAKIYDEAHTVMPRRKKFQQASSSNAKNGEQLALPPPVPTKRSSSSNSRRKKRHEKSKKTPMINTFSAEFSNEVGDERSTEGTDTLVANFLIDSSMELGSKAIINHDLQSRSSSTRRHKRIKRKPKKRSTESTTTTHSIEIIHRQSSVSSTTAEMGSSPARLSMFKKWIPCSVDGKVKESFAFVKKSEDPYEDFKRSMMEMILEKQIFEEEELEKLLQCFLSLNSTQYHILIFKAFSEISDAMFSGSSRNSIHHHRRVSSRS